MHACGNPPLLFKTPLTFFLRPWSSPSLSILFRESKGILYTSNNDNNNNKEDKNSNKDNNNNNNNRNESDRIVILIIIVIIRRRIESNPI